MTICDLGISNEMSYWNGFKTTISSPQASRQVKKVWCWPIHQFIYGKLTICRHHQDHHASTWDRATLLSRGPWGHYQCCTFSFSFFHYLNWTMLIFSSPQFQIPCQGCLMQPWSSYLPPSIPFPSCLWWGVFFEQKYILYFGHVIEWCVIRVWCNFFWLQSQEKVKESQYTVNDFYWLFYDFLWLKLDYSVKKKS